MKGNLSFDQFSFSLELIYGLDLNFTNSSNCICDHLYLYDEENEEVAFDAESCEINWNISEFLAALE